MKLIIVRHGKAERDSHSGRDEDRPLMPHGEDQARHLGAELRRGAAPGLILSSGLTRAVQTARILQRALGCPLHVEPELETGRSAAEAARLLAARLAAASDGASLVAVGHNPQLEDLVRLFTRRSTEVRVRTGEAFVLDPGDRAGAGLEGACRVVETLRLPGDAPD